ncbi:MAG: hypothetical protein WCH74_07280 [Chloroflexota bacterium]
MSAYVVALPHIAAMVALALDGPAGVPVAPDTAWSCSWPGPDGTRHATRETADVIGEMLTAECVASVRHRYRDDAHATLPGPIVPYWEAPYRHVRPRRRPTAVEALKLIDCYEYQSCEHPGWLTSEAHAAIAALRDRIIGCLDGYADAPWEWADDDPPKVVGTRFMGPLLHGTTES